MVLRAYELTKQLTRENKIMTITRGIAVAAMFTGLAVGAAATAWAELPTMSGHYIATMTSSTDQSTTSDFYFSSCGDGCLSAVLMPSGPAGAEARLVNGQWTMDKEGQSTCSEPSQVPTFQHWTWDPNTLAGTVDSTYKVAGCGLPQGYKATSHVTFRQAS